MVTPGKDPGNLMETRPMTNIIHFKNLVRKIVKSSKSIGVLVYVEGAGPRYQDLLLCEPANKTQLINEIVAHALKDDYCDLCITDNEDIVLGRISLSHRHSTSPDSVIHSHSNNELTKTLLGISSPVTL
jgi:hypothetical protein